MEETTTLGDQIMSKKVGLEARVLSQLRLLEVKHRILSQSLKP
jgi:hypothetical protein